MPKSTKRSNKIYLDYAASVYPNPSSTHALGVEAKKKLEEARKKVAQVLGAVMSEIIFTSGGTESNNLAIQGLVLAKTGKVLPHIITTNIEHASVLETFKMLRDRKLAEVSIVGVEKSGIVDPKKIKKAIKKNTVLISAMYANNEIGSIQPIKEIAGEIRHYKKTSKRNNIFFHTDAVQAVNYLDMKVERLGVDMMTLSGSKIEGGGRVGVLYKKKSVQLAPIWGGGDQEGGLRPGTENVETIVKFSEALLFSQNIKEKEVLRVTQLRDYFLHKLSQMPFGITLNGDIENRLPNNMNITIPHIPSDLLVIELSARGIMASAKSACKSGDGKASHVIEALHNNNVKSARNASSSDAGREENGALRFSLGRDTTKADIDYTIEALSQILLKLKKWYN